MAFARTGHRVRSLSWLMAFAGIACTAVVYLLFLQDQRQRFDAEFRFDASQRLELVRDAFSGLIDDLDSVGRFYEGSELVERKAFEEFAGPLVKPGHCSAILWVVPEGGAAWVDSASDIRLEALYALPSVREGLGIPLVLEHPAVKAAVAQTQRLGLTTVSAPILMPWDRLQPGVAVCRPVFGAKDDWGRRGFGAVVGLVSIGDVAWTAIASSPPAGLPTTVSDPSAGPGAPAYVHQPRLGKRLAPGSPYAGTSLTLDLEFGDRTWLLSVEPSTAYVQTRRGSLVYSTVLGGIAAFGMAAIALLMARARSVAEARAAASSEDFERFFTTGLDLFAVIRTDGTLERLNPVWEAVLGVPLGRMQGKPYSSFIHPEDAASTMSAFDRIMSRGEADGFTSRVRAGDGSYRSLECRARLAPGRRRIYVAARDISDRLTMENELRRSISEKEALLKEVHHRVKNNMQVISSLLDLEAMKHDDPAFHDAAREAQSRIRSMGMIHEQLYRQSSMSDVALGDYVRALGDRLVDEYASVPALVSVDVDNINLDLDRAIPCGLILNELLTNSLKYGTRDGVELAVNVAGAAAGGVCRLFIEDNGPGLPDGAVERSRDGATLGLGLVFGLAEQLHGALRLLPGPGARWELEFPL